MAKRLSARSTHDPNVTQDASEITATDIPQDDGSTKRGMDVVALSIIKDSDGDEAKIDQDHLQVVIKQADFRLMLAYQRRMLKELKKLNEYMALITGDEL
jgi:hypothetical protein